MERLRIEVIDRTYAAILAAKTPAERIAMVRFPHDRTNHVKVEFGNFTTDWTEQQHRQTCGDCWVWSELDILRHAVEADCRPRRRDPRQTLVFRRRRW